MLHQGSKLDALKYYSVFDHASCGFAYHRIVANRNGEPTEFIFLEVNALFELISGLKKDDIVGKRVSEVFPVIERLDFPLIDVYKQLAFVRNNVEFKFEWCFEFGNGNLYVTAHTPERGYFALLFTLSSESENKAFKQGWLNEHNLDGHDKLTGLYTRQFFEKVLRKVDKEENYPLSIVMIDINGLKSINDSLGYEEGDAALQAVADILVECFCTKGTVARWGEDEFVAIMPGIGLRAASRMCEEVQQKAQLRGLSISFGCSAKTLSSRKIEDVLREAEDRMYQQKLLVRKSVRSNVIFSIDGMLMEKTYETKEHALRMEKLSVKLGRAMGLAENELDELRIAARLHDIGKVAIPDRILNKPDKLTESEWQIMKSHAEVGHRIVKNLKGLHQVARYILHHHERWDGRGYPWGLKGEGIPLISRIIAVVDTYDVIREKRPYKKAMSHEEAIEELKRCAGTQFDPWIVDVFVKCFRD